mgnify:CR=1 FL=1
MLIALWIINALLAVAFLGAGLNKIVRTKETLLTGGMGWVENQPESRIKLVGTLEVLGALGLILPLLTHMAPILTPIAAVALAGLLVGAIVTHTRRGEKFVPAASLLVVSVASAILGFMVVLA